MATNSAPLSSTLPSMASQLGSHRIFPSASLCKAFIFFTHFIKQWASNKSAWIRESWGFREIFSLDKINTFVQYFGGADDSLFSLHFAYFARHKKNLLLAEKRELFRKKTWEEKKQLLEHFIQTSSWNLIWQVTSENIMHNLLKI